jgi:hypothetical protein
VRSLDANEAFQWSNVEARAMPPHPLQSAPSHFVQIRFSVREGYGTISGRFDSRGGLSQVQRSAWLTLARCAEQYAVEGAVRWPLVQLTHRSESGAHVEVFSLVASMGSDGSCTLRGRSNHTEISVRPDAPAIHSSCHASRGSCTRSCASRP